MPKLAATLMRKVVRRHIAGRRVPWYNRNAGHRRSPESRHPCALRAIIAIHPNIAGSWAYRPRHDYGSRRSESNSHRNPRASKRGTGCQNHCQNCFFHCLSLLRQMYGQGTCQIANTLFPVSFEAGTPRRMALFERCGAFRPKKRFCQLRQMAGHNTGEGSVLDL
jgi:hypothetical protein